VAAEDDVPCAAPAAGARLEPRINGSAHRELGERRHDQGRGPRKGDNTYGGDDDPRDDALVFTFQSTPPATAPKRWPLGQCIILLPRIHRAHDSPGPSTSSTTAHVRIRKRGS
jgi:hypothetical protein